MKLNLLPHYQDPNLQEKKAIRRGGISVLCALGLSLFMIFWSGLGLEEARAEVAALEPQAELAYRTALRADEMMKSASFLTTDLKLAEAIHRQNQNAITLFQKVMEYLPSFFRLTSLNAAPKGEQDVVVVLEGVIHSYQEYADLMLALLRMPDVSKVQRSKPDIKESPVPPLVPEDQIGISVPAGSPRIPSEPLKRMDVMIAEAAKPQPVPPEIKLPTLAGAQEYHQYVKLLPGDSVVKIEMLVKNHKFQVPNPRLTLAEVSKVRVRP